MLNELIQDIRYGLRMFPRSSGFTAVAIITLALGIGANTAIFSVVEGVILAPLPYREPDRLVAVRENSLTLKREMSLSYPDFLDWQRNALGFEQIAASNWQNYDLTAPGPPEHLNGQHVSSTFFRTLGVKLTLGRDFSPQEDRPGGAPVAIISTGLWRNRFGGSPEVLGKSVTLNGSGYTIVGVLPPAFRFLGDEAAVYTPLGQGDPFWVNDRTVHAGILCVARLKPGVTVSQASAEMSAVQNRLDALYPAANRGLGADAIPLKQEIVGDVTGTLLMLLGSVGLVLFIACANVANLLLARSAARQREFAIRAAIGASRARIVRQLVTESVILALVGGGLGLAVAKWGLLAVLAAMPGGLPRGENVGLNAAVLLFAFGVSLAVGILFGLAPAMKSSSVDLQAALKKGARGSTGSHHRAQNSLVMVQMALTLVLLTGASLLLRTIHNLWDANPGFNPQHIITFKVGLSSPAAKTGRDMRIAYQQLLERLRLISGVQSADLTTLLPLSRQSNAGPFWVGAQEPNYVSEAPRALYYETGPDYLQTMGLPLLRGRFFTADDTAKSEPVIVVDSVLAHNYFPDKNPVGQILTVGHWRPARIIGVVSHVRHWGLGDPDLYTQNQIYISFYQLPDTSVPLFREAITVTVRTTLDTAAIMPAIKAAVYGEGSGQPVYGVRTMQQIASESMAPQRFPMILLGAFAGLALLVAAAGIYGVVSYSVTQRVQEIGIRMALGAGRGNIFLMVVRHGLGLALAGLSIGIAAALILTRLLSSFSHLLYGVGASDPFTLVAVSAVLAGVALLACYVPARRATRTDPMAALRSE
jgi:predicted permease